MFKKSLMFSSRFYSGKRDTLSLYFEYVEGLKLIRVHKVYYIANEFNRLVQDNEVVEAIDMKESIIDYSIDDLLKQIIKIIDEIEFSIYFSQEKSLLRELLMSIIDKYDIHNSIERVEELIYELNNIFFKYCFSLNTHTFVIDETCEKIDNIIKIIKYKNENRHDYRNNYEPLLDNISPDQSNLYELRVFNVGQANCSALIKYKDDKKKDYNVVVVFDLGFQKKNRKNSKLNEMISKIDCNTTIIISHFHQDHINNITNHCQIMTNRWVFPSCDPSRHKAYKLFQALLCVATKKTYSGNVYVFPTPYDFSCNLSIHQHNGKAIDYYQNKDDVNAQSLVCDLNIGVTRVLIPGDALYEEYDTLNLDRPFDFVLIPHHGCLYSDKQNTLKNKKIYRVVGPDTYGIVSCGVNKYGHANISHLSWYNNYYLFYNSSIYDDKKMLLNANCGVRVDYFAIPFK